MKKKDSGRYKEAKKGSAFWPLLLILLVLGGTYAFGYFYSENHFLPRTYINGVSVSGKTIEEAEKALSGAESAPILYVQQRSATGGEPVVEGLRLKEDAGFASQISVRPLLYRQDRMRWFMCFLSEQHYTAPSGSWSMNEELLRESASRLYAFQAENTIAPQDAVVAEVDGEWQIIPEQNGCELSKEAALSAIWDAAQQVASSGADMTVSLEGFYLEADVKAESSSLQAELAIHQARQNENSQEESGAEGQEQESEESSLDSSEESVSQESASQESSSEAESSSAPIVEQGEEQLNVDAPSEEVGDNETAVFVSIAEQYLWYYIDGELMLSCPVVTGDPNADYDSTTPVGEYQVQRIAGASTLRGADYVEEVDFWIGFDWGGGGMLGFHDASWRDEFGTYSQGPHAGEYIYLYDPSHGCVNMPHWAVEKLHSLITLGTRVSIY